MLLFIMLDGLRHDYITHDDSPYLYGLTREGLSGSVIPSFGFEPDAAYLAGLQPGEADNGAMFWLDPERSPFRFTRYLPVILDNLPIGPARIIRKAIRLVAQLSAHDSRTRHWASPIWIPLPLLHRFSFSSKRMVDEPGFTPSASVFDHLRAAGYTWFFHGMPKHRVTAQGAQKRFLTEVTGGENYAFVHIGDLDGSGHRYGPNSDERKASLRQVDNALARIVDCARKRAGKVDILILGDHGMVNVEHTLDVRQIINNLKARGLTFDYFVDATLFRCWSQDKTTVGTIREEFNQLSDLLEIGEAESTRYGLHYHHNRFWDACWQAKEGLILSPNFHNHHERLLGMHGYLPECTDNQSAFVLHSHRLPEQLRDHIVEAVDMRRFFATQLSLLNIPKEAHLDLQGSLF